MTQAGVIDGQKELATVFRNRHGKNVSQTYVSHVESGATVLPEKQIYALCEYYPFTDSDYFLSGGSPVLWLSSLFRYILKKENITMTTFCEQHGLKQPDISQMNEHHADDQWQPILDILNSEYGYNLDAKTLLSTWAGNKAFEAKNSETKRFLDCVAYLIELGAFNSWTDAANRIGTKPQMFSNMRTARKSQGVTFAMAAGLLRQVPSVNPRWLMLGEGNMLLTPDEVLRTSYAGLR